MSDEATPQTLTQVNAEFLSARASRLDSAISAALQGRVEAPPPPKATKGSKTGSQQTAASSPAPATSDSAAPDSDSASTSTPDSSSSEPSPPAGTDDASANEPQDGAAEAAETGIDRTELEALAKKRDRRGIERLLGLKEGALGVGDHDYAAYRRRMDEVEAQATTNAETHERNNQTLIQKFGPAVDAIQLAQKGNLIGFARAIELTTGIRIATFVEHWAKNVQQLDPRILQLEQENAQLRARGQIVTQDGQVEKPAPVTAEAARTKANTRIQAEAKDHPALKLRGGLDDVRAKWLGSFDKATQAFRLTPKQAADAVLTERRSAHEQEQWVLSGKKPPKQPVTRTVPRQGASETQPRKSTLTREQIIEQHASLMRRGKLATR